MEIPLDWTFEDKGVARGFDAHVREQLPWYDIVSNGVAHLVRTFAPMNSRVYDIGASTGNLSRALESTIFARNIDWINIEPSLQMRNNFRGIGLVSALQAEEYTYQPFSCAVMMLSLMFIDPEERAGLLSKLYGAMKPKGAMIVVDKFHVGGGRVGTSLKSLTWVHKLAAGAEPEEIIRKEISLNGAQIPSDLMDFEDAGFIIHEWFRMGEFYGIVCTK